MNELCKGVNRHYPAPPPLNQVTIPGFQAKISPLLRDPSLLQSGRGSPHESGQNQTSPQQSKSPYEISNISFAPTSQLELKPLTDQTTKPLSTPNQQESLHSNYRTANNQIEQNRPPPLSSPTAIRPLPEPSSPAKSYAPGMSKIEREKFEELRSALDEMRTKNSNLPKDILDLRSISRVYSRHLG